MTDLSWDEAEIVRRLSRLPMEAQVAFAAACAERLLPSYLTFSHKTGRGDSTEISKILDCVWQDALDSEMTHKDLDILLKRCMALIPHEDEKPWAIEQAYAENAASAIAYALRARKSAETQEAAYAARQAYEALDHFVINRFDVDTNDPKGEKQILEHPLVQAELVRQYRDLDQLQNALGDPKRLGTVITSLRNSAKKEAEKFFQTDEPPQHVH